MKKSVKEIRTTLDNFNGSKIISEALKEGLQAIVVRSLDSSICLVKKELFSRLVKHGIVDTGIRHFPWENTHSLYGLTLKINDGGKMVYDRAVREVGVEDVYTWVWLGAPEELVSLLERLEEAEKHEHTFVVEGWNI